VSYILYKYKGRKGKGVVAYVDVHDCAGGLQQWEAVVARALEVVEGDVHL
jgi:hypothetical protein